MATSVAVILASALLPEDARLVVWAAFGIAWTLALIGFGRFPDFGVAFAPTHSLIERFDLFTIIVLGEVIFGVVDGLANAERDALTIATGLIALSVGFGFWWSYFDIVGRRLPRAGGPVMVRWLLSHLPITMAIAAAGAAMTSLIVHAHDPVVEVAGLVSTTAGCPGSCFAWASACRQRHRGVKQACGSTPLQEMAGRTPSVLL